MKKMDHYIVYGQPKITAEDIRAVVETLESKWIGTGPKASALENAFKEYKNTSHALAVNSCTAAMRLSLKALGVGEGDEVITTDFTFCATINAIIHCGARPVPVDVLPEKLTIDPALIEKAITPKTKAIIPVHYAGYPCEMDEILAIAKRHNLYIVEDCAHAIETLYRGQPAGSIGDLGCFSFYVTKNITSAEGGMVVTSRSDWAEKIKILSLHGMDKDAWKRYSDDGFKFYEVVDAGFKYNLTDLQASLALSQFSRIEKDYERRENIFNQYHDKLKGLNLGLPAKVEEGSRHAYHLFPVMVSKEDCGLSREELIKELHEKGIGTGVHFPSIHTHAYYRESFNLDVADFPISAKASSETLSLPLSPGLLPEEIEYIIDSVTQVIQKS